MFPVLSDFCATGHGQSQKVAMASLKKWPTRTHARALATENHWPTRAVLSTRESTRGRILNIFLFVPKNLKGKRACA